MQKNVKYLTKYSSKSSENIGMHVNIDSLVFGYDDIEYGNEGLRFFL